MFPAYLSVDFSGLSTRIHIEGILIHFIYTQTFFKL